MLDTLTIRPSSVTSSFLRFSQADSTKIDRKAATNSSRILLPVREIILFEKITAGWQIVQPLTITIEHSDGLYIASDDIFGVYGDTDTEYNALEDYKISLRDYYKLIKIRAQDDKQTQALLRHLQFYISPGGILFFGLTSFV